TLEGNHTYGELASTVMRLANFLARAGGVKGDRVILLAENSFFWVAAYLATMRAGMVCVPVGPNVADEELRQIVDTTDARLVFVLSKFVKSTAAWFGRLNVI